MSCTGTKAYIQRFYLAALIALVSVGVVQADITADEVLERSRLFGAGRTAELRARLSITDSDGERSRVIVVWLDQSGQDRRVFAQVVDPGFLRNLKFLHLNERGRETTYVSTSRGVRRVAARSTDEPLFGSDFTMQDFSSFSIEDGTVSRLTDRESEQLYVVEVVVEAELPRRVLAVQRESFMVESIEQFDQDGQLAKKYTLHEQDTLDGELYVRSGSMQDLRSGSRSVLTVESARFHNRAPSHIFLPGRL